MEMKKITGLVCALFFAQLSFGQITLEHVYDNTVTGITRSPTDIMTIKFYSNDTSDQTFTIYNLDHSIYKTVKLYVPDGASIGSLNSFYTDFINTDPLIEFTYSIWYKDSQNNNVKDTYIINEDGELIKKFEKAYLVTINCTENSNKLWVHKSESKEIYSLPTTLSHVPSMQVENTRFPYPNPAGETINIPYQLSGKRGTVFIYGASGGLIEQKKVDGNFSDLQLDVSGYAKGMYYYKVDKQRGEFMVK